MVQSKWPHLNRMLLLTVIITIPELLNPSSYFDISKFICHKIAVGITAKSVFDGRFLIFGKLMTNFRDFRWNNNLFMQKKKEKEKTLI